MASIIKVDQLSEKTQGSGITLSHSLKLKSSGDSITASDGTTSVLSESGGVVTLNNGTFGSGVVFPAGHVIQVVQFLDNTNSASTTSTSLVDAVDGSSNPILEKNITITAGNSVLIIANLTQQISGGGADKAGHVGLKRILDPSGVATTSTVYQQGSDAIYAESLASGATLTITMNNNICYLDSSTSSATNITYRLMHSAGIRGGSSLIRGNSYYTMTLFEIQA